MENLERKLKNLVRKHVAKAAKMASAVERSVQKRIANRVAKKAKRFAGAERFAYAAKSQVCTT